MVQSKETALYQENKIGDDIQHAEASATAAARTATTYITEVSESGITVHPSNTTNNRVEINGSGMEVFKANESVAKYGDTARIGKDPIASNAGNVFVDSDSVDIRKGNVVLSTFTADGASIGKNSDSAVVDFCNGIGVIEGHYDSAEQGLRITTAIEDNTEAILPWIQIQARETSSSQPTSTYGEVNIAPADVSLSSLSYDENDNEKNIEFHITDTGASLIASDTADGFASFGISCPETTASISMKINDAGTNYGIWSDEYSAWLIAMAGGSGGVYSPKVYEKTSSGGSNVRVSSEGFLRRYVSSSRRYKEDIADISDKMLDPNRLYDARVVQFRYKEDHLDKDDQRYGKLVDGFIAEELEEVYPICVNYENGKVEDWEPKFLIPAMLKLIQDQHKEIEKLKNDISKIKGE